MPSITVKNIPEEIYNRVREQAKAHHRSINSEIIACLERTVKPQQLSSDDILHEARRLLKKVKGNLSSEEIESAINQGRPVKVIDIDSSTEGSQTLSYLPFWSFETLCNPILSLFLMQPWSQGS
ncbi:MAG: Arc family DNA-binding protein [Balneolaceae bacterium]|nr:Arc family DNA-binding protein [Balneolaceae bacterium]